MNHPAGKPMDGAAGSGRRARVLATRLPAPAPDARPLDALADALARELRAAANAAEMLRDGDFSAGALADDLEGYRARIGARIDAAVAEARRRP